jgi:hypothetical protein
MFNTDKFYKRILYTITFFTYLYIVTFTFLHNRKNDGYILGDWLINYQDGGFKRRGLSGSFFFFLQDITGLSLNSLVYAFQVIIISLFFFFYFKLIKDKQITIYYLSLLLSPLGFIAYFNCVDYVGKKEFILFAIFSYFTFQISKSALNLKKEYLVCFLLLLSVLFHEIVLFFIPYFLLLLALKDDKIIIKKYIKYLLAVSIPAILILVFGHKINEGNSLSILRDRGVVIEKGIFFWDINEREYILSHWKDYILYFISFIISFLHVRFYLKISFTQWKKIGFYLLLAFLFSLPLFILAIDWGRWFYIHMIMIIVILGVLLKTRKDNNLVQKRFLITGNNIILLLFMLFSLTYRVEMSGKGFSFQGFFYRIFFVPLELIHKMI